MEMGRLERTFDGAGVEQASLNPFSDPDPDPSPEPNQASLDLFLP